jgi:hypothetical protein
VTEVLWAIAAGLVVLLLMFGAGVTVEWFVIVLPVTVVGSFWHGLRTFSNRVANEALSGIWNPIVACAYTVALGVMWSVFPSYLVIDDGGARGQFAFRQMDGFGIFSLKPGGPVVDWGIVALEMIGLATVAALLMLVGKRAGFDDKWKRCRQKQRVRRQHTTCEGCMDALDNECRHNSFMAYLPEGAVRSCYRKRSWGQRSDKS